MVVESKDSNHQAEAMALARRPYVKPSLVKGPRLAKIAACDGHCSVD